MGERVKGVKRVKGEKGKETDLRPSTLVLRTEGFGPPTAGKVSGFGLRTPEDDVTRAPPTAGKLQEAKRARPLDRARSKPAMPHEASGRFVNRPYGLEWRDAIPPYGLSARAESPPYEL